MPVLRSIGQSVECKRTDIVLTEQLAVYMLSVRKLSLHIQLNPS